MFQPRGGRNMAGTCPFIQKEVLFQIQLLYTLFVKSRETKFIYG